MKVVKTSNLSSRKEELPVYDKALDADVSSICTALAGRIRFGTGTDGARGENISGEFQVFTTSGTPDTEGAVAHTLGSIPIGYIVLKQNKAGSIYIGASAWTKTSIYLASDIASVACTVFLLK